MELIVAKGNPALQGTGTGDKGLRPRSTVMASTSEALEMADSSE